MNRFHPLVWQLLVGMVLVRTASFMTLPFLAIYMQNEFQASPLLIGLAVGIAPLTATFGGVIGGYLTDRFGRKKIIFASMVTWALTFFGFAFATVPWMFIILNGFNGLSRAFFEPSSQALMIDYTIPQKRRRLFSLRYTLINFSAVVGPLIGVLLANLKEMKLAFYLTGSLYIICYLFFFIVLYHVKESKQSKKVENPMVLFQLIMKDHILLFIVLGSIFASIAYAQMDSTLSQLLNLTFSNGIVLYSVLIAVNAVTVMLFQLPLSILTEKYPVKHTLVFGSMLTIVGMFGFYLADGWISYIGAMIFISLGEIFIWPLVGVVIETIAPPHQKATYLGVMQFQSFGGFIGPIFGGWLLIHYPAQLFLIMTAITVGMVLCYLFALRKNNHSII